LAIECPAEAQAHAQMSCAMEGSRWGAPAFQAEYLLLLDAFWPAVARQKLPLLLPGRLNARCCCNAVVAVRRLEKELPGATLYSQE